MASLPTLKANCRVSYWCLWWCYHVLPALQVSWLWLIVLYGVIASSVKKVTDRDFLEKV